MTVRFRFLFVLIFLGIGNYGLAQNATNSLIGQAMDTFRLEKIIQSPYKSLEKWEPLKGKVIILEFWTTWCAPCIKEIPHLNELNEKFSKKPIQFISITYENEELVQRFLKRKEMKSWVGLDIDKSIMNKLEVTYYPLTVIIDKKGIIREITSPEKLTQQKIEQYLLGNFPDTPDQDQVALKDALTNGLSNSNKNTSTEDKPIYQVLFKESKSKEVGGGLTAKEMGRISLIGVPLRQLVSIAYGIPEVLVKGDTSILNKLYDLRLILPADVSLVEKILQNAIKKVTGITIESKEEDVSIYALSIKANGLKNMYVSTLTKGGHASEDVGVIASQGYSFDFLVSVLQTKLNMLIENNTGLTEKYDFQFFFDEKNLDSIAKSLDEQFGLLLSPARKNMKVLYVKGKM